MRKVLWLYFVAFFLPATFTSVADTVIIDNSDSGVVFVTTNWTYGATAGGKYGADYRFASTVAGSPTYTATYTPTIVTPGKYDIYVWYPAGSNRAADAPWTISYNGGTVIVPVNQQINGGAWYLIASCKDFAAGTSGYIRLANNTGTTGFVVMADAVQVTSSLAPTITTQPINKTVCPNTAVTFTVSATGSATLTYQWKKNGTDISGATSSSLALGAVTAANAGTYSVQVVNPVGSATSSGAILTVKQASAITTQPLSQAVCPGSSATFSVTASGTAPLTYQWRFNGVNISGATASSFTRGAVTSSQVGNYSVLVNNSCGSVTSADANLSLKSPAEIVTQPESQSVIFGNPVTFTVSAQGSSPLTYQWKFNGSALSGATTSSLNIAEARYPNVGSYSVVVENACGSVTSADAILGISRGMFVDAGPDQQLTLPGSVVINSVIRDDGAPLGTEISTGWTLISGPGSVAFSDPYVANPTIYFGQAGTYVLELYANDGDYDNTDSVTVTVSAETACHTFMNGSFEQGMTGWAFAPGTGLYGPPYVTSVGIDGNYCALLGGGNVPDAVLSQTFCVTPGATYRVSFEYAALGGSSMTGKFRAEAKVGGNVLVAEEYTATATGTFPIESGHHWPANLIFTVPATESTAIVSFTDISPNGGVAVDPLIDKVSLELCTPVSIVTQPQSASVPIGTNVSFSVEATGTAPITYQWKKNGVSLSNGPTISGATSATLTISSVSSGDAGSYSVVVSNPVGPISSSSAVLTVIVPPTITKQPSSVTVSIGNNVSFIVEPTGGAPYTYQWFKNGNTINCATQPELFLANVAVSDSGTYTVEVRNLAGTVLSSSAVLTVTTADPILYAVATPGGIIGTGNPLVQVPEQQSRTRNSTVTVTAVPNEGYAFAGWAGDVTGSQSQITVQMTKDVHLWANFVSTSVTELIIDDPTALYEGPWTVGLANGQRFGSTYHYADATLVSPSSVAFYVADIVAPGKYDTYIWYPSSATYSANAQVAVVSPVPDPLNPAQTFHRTVSVNQSINGGAWVPLVQNVPCVPPSGAYPDFSSKSYVKISSDTGEGNKLVIADAVRFVAADVSPLITGQPRSQVVEPNGTANFSVGAAGPGPFKYQWRVNGIQMVGETAASFTIQNVQASHAGTYTVTVRLQDESRPVTSEPAVLSVPAAPVITGQPQSAVVCAGSPVTFRVTATGSLLTYQWKHNNIAIAGANECSYTIANPSISDAGSYTVQVIRPSGSIVSSVATLTVNATPSITAQPQNLNVCVGSSATFNVSANSSLPLTYQWNFNGNPVSGATQSSYTVANASAANIGTYKVTVGNACSSVSSVDASLQVSDPPFITTQPQGQIACGQLSVSVLAGPPGVTFQWERNGDVIVGATASRYTVNPVGAADGGTYTVVVGNVCGNLTSDPAVIRVSGAPAELVNVDIGPGSTSPKSGVAAVGLDNADFWNLMGPQAASWVTAAPMTSKRGYHTATLLPSGKVLLVGGRGDANAYLSSTELFDCQEGTWTPGAPLSGPRADHTATLLLSGKILVAGGRGSDGSNLATAELYDAATDTWTGVAPMNTARGRHTATLLSNGKVLVVGGKSGATTLSTAELYDPATGVWTSVPAMASARFLHTATLLADGKVLVAGGMGGEVYDPIANTWAQTGPMSGERTAHTATLLQNGKVLIAGGENGTGQSSAEEFDPTTSTFTLVGAMSTPRALHRAVLLPNGNVLVSGISGDNTCELYNPATGTWTLTAPMNSGSFSATMTLLSDGNVLVAGGVSGGPVAAAEIYHPSRVAEAASWVPAGAMLSKRYLHTATLLPSGKVLVVGGRDSATYTSKADLFDPEVGTWTATAPLSGPRADHTATLLSNGKVLVAGGRSANGTYLSTADVYDSATGTWVATAPMNSARRGHTATLLANGKVLVIGGTSASSTYLSSAELYDPATGVWTFTPAMTVARSYHTATLLPDGKVLIVGGRDDTNLSFRTAELYDPIANTWSQTGSMAVGRIAHTATLLLDGKLLIAGGVGPNGAALSGAELYDPATAIFTAVGSMNVPRALHTAVLLENGNVLVSGIEEDNRGELYNPTVMTWTPTAAMNEGRSFANMTLLSDGNILVTGGNASGATVDTAEIYRPGFVFALDSVRGADQTLTPIALKAENLGLFGSFTSSDPMLDTYHSSDVANLPTAITIKNLEAGTYDFYLYGHGPEDADSTRFELVVGGILSAPKATSYASGWKNGPWANGIQYVRFGSVSVANGQTVVVRAQGRISAAPAFINGLQIGKLADTDNPPTITSQPQNQLVCEGSPATFVVAATPEPLTYQWMKNGTDIAGATTSTYSVAAVNAANCGTYSVTIANQCGMEITSAPATLVLDDCKKILVYGPTSGGVAETTPKTIVTVWSEQEWEGKTTAEFAQFDAIIFGDQPAGDVHEAEWNTAIGNRATWNAAVNGNVILIGTDPDNHASQGRAGAEKLVHQAVKFAADRPGKTGLYVAMSHVYESMDFPMPVRLLEGLGHFVAITSGGNNAAHIVAVHPALNGLTDDDLKDWGASTHNGFLSWPQDFLPLAIVTDAPVKTPDYLSGDGKEGLVYILSRGASPVGVSLTVEPSCMGGPIVVTALVNDAFGNPRANIPVRFSLLAGSANFGVSGSCTPTGCRTGADGKVVWSYLGNNPGSDNIFAFTDLNDNGIQDYGELDSSRSRVSVGPPAIVQQPVTTRVCVGNDTALNVVAAPGLAPVTYQWRKDRVPLLNTPDKIEGATSPTLVIRNAAATDENVYDVVIANGCGSTTSSLVGLGVSSSGPVITSQPTGLTQCSGSTATFSVAYDGTHVLRQWFKIDSNTSERVALVNGGRISGAKSSTLTITSVEESDAGNYQVELHNGCDTVSSQFAFLQVDSAPVINAGPSIQPVVPIVGNGAAITVDVGQQSLNFQWTKNGQNIPDATQATYNISPVAMTDEGTYRVIVANSCGSSVSTPVVMVVSDGTPVIATQPASQTVIPNQAVTFNVVAGGNPTLSYQWRFNGTPISGATDTSYTISSAQYSDVGSYSVFIHNDDGSVTSADAVLTIPDPVIIRQPRKKSAEIGQNVTFTVSAMGKTVLSYQWNKNGVNIAGATGTALTLNNVQTSDAGTYVVTVTDFAASLDSMPATLAVKTPYYVTLPASVTDHTFASGVTYFIPSDVVLHGSTAIEGGSILKFATGASLHLTGTLNCLTEPYRPAIFTSKNDDTVGTVISGSTGLPQISSTSTYLDLDSVLNAETVAVRNLRICYADNGISAPFESGHLDVFSSQFINCNVGVVSRDSGSCSTINLRNVLFSQCGAVIRAEGTCTEVNGEHLTADVTEFWTSGFAPTQVSLVNSIIRGSFGTGPVISTDHVAINPAGDVFQTVGAGAYYLLADSPYRNNGSTSISAETQAELKGKTTQPPIAFPVRLEISGEMTLSPQTPRYTSGSPDCGYHYDALDYTVAGLAVSGTINVLPGTAVGIRRDYESGVWSRFGFDLLHRSRFKSFGMHQKPNVFTSVQSVQEGPGRSGVIAFVPDFEPDHRLDENGELVWDDLVLPAAPVVDFRFSHFYFGTDEFAVWCGMSEFGATASLCSSVQLNLQDCHLSGGGLNFGNPDPLSTASVYAPGSINFINNLFENVDLYVSPTYYADGGPINVDLAFHASNNTFRNGRVYLDPISTSDGNWSLRDNFFDKVAFEQDLGGPIDHDHNGYWKRLPAELGVGQTDALAPNDGDGTTDAIGDQLLDAPLAYETGPCGRYYLPVASQLNNAGSRTPGAAGLYHYTTRVDQLKDGEEPSSPNLVNIGMHYVASAATTTSVARDSDGDGIADYIEDANGNGTSDEGETSFLLSQTQTGVSDQRNDIYKDFDLDGDGLTGRAESLLGTQPMISDNPLVLAQVSPSAGGGANNLGIVEFTVPINKTLLGDAGTVELSVSGTDAELQSCTTTGEGQCLLTWNTLFSPPGQHFLQPHLMLPYALGEGAISSVPGKIRPYFSPNVLQFFEPYSMFSGNSAFIDAKLSEPNATYSLDLYDASTQPPSLIRRLDDQVSVTSDEILVDWNVTYADGVTPFTGNTVEAVFTVTLNSSGRSGSGKKILHRYVDNVQQMSQRAESFSANGAPGGPDQRFNFVYFYTPEAGKGDDILLREHDYNGDIWWRMQSAVDTLIQPQGPRYYFSAFNHYGVVTVAKYPGYLKNKKEIKDLFLPQVLGARNFYCHGHGSPDTIAGSDYGFPHPGSPHWDNPDHPRIDAKEISAILGNSMDPNTGYITQSSYRFVFLDCCSTAKNNTWARAFGISHIGVPTSQGIRYDSTPRAYVGWKQDRTAFLSGDSGRDKNGNPRPRSKLLSTTLANGYTVTINKFFIDWMSGWPLSVCLDNASDPRLTPIPLPVPSNKQIQLDLYPNRTGDPLVTFPVADVSDIVVIGHAGLTYDSCDHRYDNIPRYTQPYK